MHDVIVVGAGISGLVTAHGLRRQGLDVAVIEAGPRAGGVIGTVQADGVLYELGPNSTLDTTPLIGELVSRLGLGDELRLASPAAEKRYVVRDGVMRALPTAPATFLTSPLFSPWAKLGLLRELFVPAGDPQREESIAAFVKRRLGREFLDYAIDPFVSGVYAGDPKRISVPAAFPRLHALEQRWGSLIKGQILGAAERRRQKEAAKNTAKSFSFATGMQALTDALAATVSTLVLGTRATRIVRGADGVYTLATEGPDGAGLWQARALVLATPADVTAALLRPHHADAAEALSAIAYAPVATVASLYQASTIAHPLDGFGCLLPGKEGRRILGVLFSSTLYAGRAGPGQALLTTFIGGQRSPELAALPESEIATLAHAEHAALLGASQPPSFQAVTRWPRAIPQYNLGHLSRVARAEVATRQWPGLHLCANWKGGVAVGDCIKNGHQTADAVAAGLRNSERQGPPK